MDARIREAGGVIATGGTKIGPIREGQLVGREIVAGPAFEYYVGAQLTDRRRTSIWDD